MGDGKVMVTLNRVSFIDDGLIDTTFVSHKVRWPRFGKTRILRSTLEEHSEEDL
jgi:hypothetical protein